MESGYRFPLLGRSVHIVSMTDPKYLPMMGLPMLVPYVALGPVNWWLVAGGIVGVIVLNMTAVFLNTFTDRQGDEISFPEGVRATEEHVGYARMKHWLVPLYALLALGSLVIAVFVSWAVAAIYVAGWTIATIYSAGPRIKRNLLLSRLCMACGPFLAFAGGWALRQPLWELPPVAGLLFVGQGLHLLLKDVPDVDGDRRMGVKTLFTGLRPAQLRVLLPALWTIPYVVVALGVGAGLLPPRYLALWVLWPAAMFVVCLPFLSENRRERQMVREIAQIFSSAYVFANLILFAPTLQVVAICASGFAFYLVALVLRVDRRGQPHGPGTLLHFAGTVIRTRLGRQPVQTVGRRA